MSWRTRESEYTELVKQIDLTDEQALRCRRIDRLSAMLRDRLSNFMLDLFEQDVLDQEDKWQGIAELFGYSSLQAVYDAGCSLRVDSYEKWARLHKKPDRKDKGDGEENGKA